MDDIDPSERKYDNPVDMQQFLNDRRALILLLSMITEMNNAYGSDEPISDFDIQLAQMEISQWCQCDISVVSVDVVYMYIRCWKSSSTGRFPRVDEFVENATNTGCRCLSNFENKYDIMKHFIINLGRIPTCVEVELCFIFNRDYGDFPTEDDLTELMMRAMRMNNMEEFHQDDKVTVPTENLDKLKPVTSEQADVFCTLCQDEIKQGTERYILTPCGHEFHSADCLGDDSIVTWLSKNKTCPVCKAEIVINNESVNISSKHQTDIINASNTSESVETSGVGVSDHASDDSMAKEG